MDGRGDEEGKTRYEKWAYSVHIGQAHFPFEEPCGLHVTEVEVTFCWMSQPPPASELAVVVTPTGESSSSSSSVLRLRSIISPSVIVGTPVEFCASWGAIVSPLRESPGRRKNPMWSSSLLCSFNWSSDESPVCIESRRAFRRSSSCSTLANSTSSSESDEVLSSEGFSVGERTVSLE